MKGLRLFGGLFLFEKFKLFREFVFVLQLEDLLFCIKSSCIPWQFAIISYVPVNGIMMDTTLAAFADATARMDFQSHKHKAY